MFKIRRNFFIFGLLAFIGQFSVAQKAIAFVFKISPFTL